MYKDKTVTGVIVAAGSSSRMGLDINKVYINAKGGLIVEYSLAAFDSHPYIDDIVVAVRPQDKGLLEDIVQRRCLSKPVRIVHGGKTRADSVYNAISGLASDIVVIHDGARPLIRQQYITDCVEAMEGCSGAVIAVKSEHAVSTRTGDGFRCEMPGQDALYLAQTPQCFHTGILLDCHRAVVDKSVVTDDSSLLEMAGYAVKILPGDHTNIKITTPVDVTLAEIYLADSEL